MNLAYLLDPVFQIEGINGKPLVEGYIEVYLAGTVERYITYQSFDGVKNPFKVPLSADGRATVLADQTHHYDIYVYDSFSNLVCSRKNVSCVGFVSVVNKDNVQVVTYDVTKWTDIDFTEQLMLRYIYHDTVVSSAAYTCTDTALKFYVDIENEVYVVQLLHDTNEWSATKVDASSVYVATWGAPLASLNSISPDVLVYTKYDDDVYMCSYRSNTEWRFTCIDGDMINEAVVIEQGWTNNAISIGGNSTLVILRYGDAVTQTNEELTQLFKQGRLYVLYQDTQLIQCKGINFGKAFAFIDETNSEHEVNQIFYNAGSSQWYQQTYDTYRVMTRAKNGAEGYLGNVMSAGEGIALSYDSTGKLLVTNAANRIGLVVNASPSYPVDQILEMFYKDRTFAFDPTTTPVKTFAQVKAYMSENRVVYGRTDGTTRHEYTLTYVDGQFSWSHDEYELQTKLTFDSTPTSDSSNPVTSDGIKKALDAKQDKLTIDSTPTKNSSNPVSSGGVYTAIAPLNSAAFSCVYFNVTPSYQTAKVFNVTSKDGSTLFKLTVVLGQSNLLVNMTDPTKTWTGITEDFTKQTLTTNTYQVNKSTSKQLANIDWTVTHNVNIQLVKDANRLNINLYHYSNYESCSIQIISNVLINEQQAASDTPIEGPTT